MKKINYGDDKISFDVGKTINNTERKQCFKLNYASASLSLTMEITTPWIYLEPNYRENP